MNSRLDAPWFGSQASRKGTWARIGLCLGFLAVFPFPPQRIPTQGAAPIRAFSMRRRPAIQDVSRSHVTCGRESSHPDIPAQPVHRGTAQDAPYHGEDKRGIEKSGTHGHSGLRAGGGLITLGVTIVWRKHERH